MFDLKNYLINKIQDVLSKEYLLSDSDIYKMVGSLTVEVEDDIYALKEKDPALLELSYQSVFKYSTSFKAVFYHRLGNKLIAKMPSCKELVYKNYQNILANTGIDIHPKAKIGKEFVLDHAPGTVIGETTVIGDNCYFLGNITLGARGIANNKKQKRHPTIGNNVQIGAGVRILGDVDIGDDVFISPNSLILKDIPRNNKVMLSNLIQVSTPISTVTIYGLVPKSYGFIIYGANLSDVESIDLMFGKQSYNIGIIKKTEHMISAHIYSHNDSDCCYDSEKIILKTAYSDIIVHASHALNKYRENLTMRYTRMIC